MVIRATLPVPVCREGAGSAVLARDSEQRGCSAFARATVALFIGGNMKQTCWPSDLANPFTGDSSIYPAGVSRPSYVPGKVIRPAALGVDDGVVASDVSLSMGDAGKSDGGAVDGATVKGVGES
jgi:hypothetical protein